MKHSLSYISILQQKNSRKVNIFHRLYYVRIGIIGISEMYVSTAGRDKGIASVKTNAPDAEIVDLT